MTIKFDFIKSTFLLKDAGIRGKSGPSLKKTIPLLLTLVDRKEKRNDFNQIGLDL